MTLKQPRLKIHVNSPTSFILCLRIIKQFLADIPGANLKIKSQAQVYFYTNQGNVNGTKDHVAMIETIVY